VPGSVHAIAARMNNSVLIQILILVCVSKGHAGHKCFSQLVDQLVLGAAFGLSLSTTDSSLDFFSAEPCFGPSPIPISSFHTRPASQSWSLVRDPVQSLFLLASIQFRSTPRSPLSLQRLTLSLYSVRAPKDALLAGFVSASEGVSLIYSLRAAEATRTGSARHLFFSCGGVVFWLSSSSSRASIFE
jgi:hypothetical protein